jgi:isoleucyl-tRNA synthetase
LVTGVDSSAPESVHLSRWPKHDEGLIDRQAIAEMRVVEKLVSLGRAARENANLKVRQPLRMAQFVTRESAEAEAVQKMADLIQSELNVKQVSILQGAGDVVRYMLNPLPRLLGKKFGKDFPALQKALREGDPGDVRRWSLALMAGSKVTVEVNGQKFEVTPEEVEVQQQAAEGYAVVEEAGYLAALDTTLTEDLIMEGLAREVVRRVQTLRKDADFNIADTIAVRYVATERLAKAIQQFADYIRAETLGEVLEQGTPDDGFRREDFEFDGEKLSLGVKRLKAND